MFCFKITTPDATGLVLVCGFLSGADNGLLDLKRKQFVTDRAFSINKVSLAQVFSCGNTGSIRDDAYWTSRKNSLELTELSSINKVSLV